MGRGANITEGPLGRRTIGALAAITIALCVAGVLYFGGDPRVPAPVPRGYVEDQRPDFLSYAELTTLSGTPYAELEAELRQKLGALLRTPFISNDEY